MTPKEKAEELYRTFRGFNSESKEFNHNTAIQCAGLCVDEIIKDYKNSMEAVPELPHVYIGGLLHWQEVKQEIEKL